MRDLNDIIDGNTKATQAAIPRERAAGHWVCEKYTGVNFLGYSKHDTEEEATAAAAEHRKTPGFTAKVHAPLVGAPV